jgi:hypothetical protein
MTDPLTDPECDLRDFQHMQLDVVRLRDSDLAAMESPEACWAAVLLWCASWHQVPAASLPDDDRVLANLSGYGRVVKEWMRVRSGALRGWVKCSDGRLYHPVVADKANEAWSAKLRQRWKTECARIKKHNDRHGTAHLQPTYEEWLSSGCPSGQMLSVPRDKSPSPSNVPRETHSKGEGEGEGEGYIEEKISFSEYVVGAADAAPAQITETVVPQSRTAKNRPTEPKTTRLPDEWKLPKAWGEWALAEFPTWTPDGVRIEGDKFADHWRTKSGKDARKADWLAAWRNWCRSDIAQRAHRQIHAPPSAQAETFRERDLRIAAERVREAAPGIEDVNALGRRSSVLPRSMTIDDIIDAAPKVAPERGPKLLRDVKNVAAA